MPGDLLKLHICFKSDKGGIFTEKWEFVTEPKLLSGASLVLTLRGVAIQEDKHKKTRALIEVKKTFIVDIYFVIKTLRNVFFVISIETIIFKRGRNRSQKHNRFNIVRRENTGTFSESSKRLHHRRGIVH